MRNPTLHRALLIVFIAFLCLLTAVGAVACSLIPVSSRSTGSGGAQILPQPVTAVATLVAPPAITSEPVEDITATPAATLAGDNLSVTLTDQGRTLELHVGQRFLLNLGEGFNWSLAIADPQVISRVPNIMVIRGAQGIYEARAAGQTTLTATGDPPCRQSKPACMLPSRVFMLNIHVIE